MCSLCHVPMVLLGGDVLASVPALVVLWDRVGKLTAVTCGSGTQRDSLVAPYFSTGWKSPQATLVALC